MKKIVRTTKSRGEVKQDARADYIRRAIDRLKNRKDAGRLTIMDVARSDGTSGRRLKNTHARLQYLFGTPAGLTAAIAAKGFAELKERLKVETGKPGCSVRDLALAHAYFGLDNPSLYQTMHAAEVWHIPERKKPASRFDTVEDELRAGARKSRDEGLSLYLKALEKEKLAGGFPSHSSPEVVFRVFTALVDGFLFQRFFEDKDEKDDPREDVEKLIQGAFDGIAPPQHSAADSHLETIAKLRQLYLTCSALGKVAKEVVPSIASVRLLLIDAVGEAEQRRLVADWNSELAPPDQGLLLADLLGPEQGHGR